MFRVPWILGYFRGGGGFWEVICGFPKISPCRYLGILRSGCQLLKSPNMLVFPKVGATLFITRITLYWGLDDTLFWESTM